MRGTEQHGTGQEAKQELTKQTETLTSIQGHHGRVIQELSLPHQLHGGVGQLQDAPLFSVTEENVVAFPHLPAQIEARLE